MTTYRVAYLPGDGIGPEVCAVARRCVDAAGERFGFLVSWDEQLVGGAAMDALGQPLPAATLAACREADAVLLGAVGGPAWDDPTAAARPEDALLELRSSLELFANLRPGARSRVARGGLTPATGGPPGCGHPHRARADRRPLLRETAGARGIQRRHLGGRHASLRSTGDRAHRGARIRACGRSSRPPHQRRQGERPRHQPAVAGGRRRGRRASSGGHASSTRSSTRPPTCS